jgi:hypothetical protein
MEVSGQLHAPAALPPGKEPLVPVANETVFNEVCSKVCIRRHLYDALIQTGLN